MLSPGDWAVALKAFDLISSKLALEVSFVSKVSLRGMTLMQKYCSTKPGLWKTDQGYF
jgi:hypothetical protein